MNRILTDKQVRFFRRQGYLAIDVLTTPEDVVKLRKSYDRLFAEQAGRDQGSQFDLAGVDDGEKATLPQIMEPARYAPEMNESLLLKRASLALSQLLDEQVEASFEHAIFKPAKHGAETPWHQDAAYWAPEMLHSSLSVWIPLQEATLENGCMEFVPESHTLDVVPHQPINNDPRIHGLELRPDQMHLVEGAVACPLPPGGATFHGGYMLHHAGANRSDIPRRALILSGSVKGENRKDPVRFPWLDQRQTARQQRAANTANNPKRA